MDGYRLNEEIVFNGCPWFPYAPFAHLLIREGDVECTVPLNSSNKMSRSVLGKRKDTS